MPDTPTAEEIEQAAGTEDETGVIQPGVDEILDEDPEHADGDADPQAMESAQKDAAERQQADGGGYE